VPPLYVLGLQYCCALPPAPPWPAPLPPAEHAQSDGTHPPGASPPLPGPADEKPLPAVLSAPVRTTALVALTVRELPVTMPPMVTDVALIEMSPKYAEDDNAPKIVTLRAERERRLVVPPAATAPRTTKSSAATSSQVKEEHVSDPAVSTTRLPRMVDAPPMRRWLTST
jgi:hypothetical protein